MNEKRMRLISIAVGLVLGFMGAGFHGAIIGGLSSWVSMEVALLCFESGDEQ